MLFRSLTNQECRDIAYYLSNLPRPAGDKQGPLMALQQQALMIFMPPLMRYAESLRKDGEAHNTDTTEPAR